MGLFGPTVRCSYFLKMLFGSFSDHAGKHNYQIFHQPVKVMQLKCCIISKQNHMLRNNEFIINFLLCRWSYFKKKAFSLVVLDF